MARRGGAAPPPRDPAPPPRDQAPPPRDPALPPRDQAPPKRGVSRPKRGVSLLRLAALLAVVALLLVAARALLDSLGTSSALDGERASRAVVLVVWPGVPPERLPLYAAGGAVPLPHLDRLARHGVVAERHVPSCEASAAALATLLTGLAPGAHGLGSLRTPGRQRLPAAVPTLAARLAEQGWRTLAAVGPAQLDGELTGLRAGFDTWLGGPLAGAADPSAPFDAWLAELERELAAGRSVLALLCEEAPAAQPSPRGPRAAFHVRRALELVDEPEVRALGSRLVPGPDADSVLDRLDELLLRRRGDPVREALLEAYRAVALERLDGRLGRVLEVLRARPATPWTAVVTGLSGPPVAELADPHDEPRTFPAELRVPLVVGGWPALEAPERVAGLTRDLDLAALLLEAARGPREGAPIPWRRSPFAEPRSGAVLHAAELTSALIWLAAEDDLGRLLRIGPGSPEPAQPWAARARTLAAEGGRYGRLELAARGLEGRELMVRTLTAGNLLHTGGPGVGRPRVVVRLGLGADEPAAVESERRAPALVLRLPVGDEGRVWLGGRPLLELDATLLPAPDGPEWPAGEEPVVAVRELGAGRLALALSAAPGEPVRLVLEPIGPDPHAELEELPGRAASRPHPRRPLARVVESAGSIVLEVLPPRGASLALAAFVDGARVPAARMRWGERRFAGESLDLVLTPWCWSDTELLVPPRPGADAVLPGHPGLPGLPGLPDGALAIALSDPPPPGGEVHPLDARQRILVERLGAGE